MSAATRKREHPLDLESLGTIPELFPCAERGRPAVTNASATPEHEFRKLRLSAVAAISVANDFARA